jgi:hypothetical protein
MGSFSFRNYSFCPDEKDTFNVNYPLQKDNVAVHRHIYVHGSVNTTKSMNIPDRADLIRFAMSHPIILPSGIILPFASGRRRRASQT